MRRQCFTHLIISVEYFKFNELSKWNALSIFCAQPIGENIFNHFLSDFMSWRVIAIETSENIVGNVQVTKIAEFKEVVNDW